MAASNRILCLDLGTQNVGIAEFQASKTGGLVLANYRSTGLLADPAADATRNSQARMAAGEMVAALGLKGATVNYSISAQNVFTRFVKLPHVGEEQVDQIVAFEAQQNVPFPIDEVVWDYQLVEGNAGEVEVVLVAIKSDLLDDINAAVEDSGLRTNVVDVSPMALYNAYRYNYGDQDGCTLIIDLGARTTNLLFVEPKKVFTRTIPSGGSKITEAIAKDFGEPFGEAEERKKRDGFVSLGGAYSDPDDPDIARVSKMIRNVMTRLHSDIARSISFYRAQQHGSQPVRVLLCGGTSTLPYMREFFHEKLQLPVEFFNPLRNVTVGPKLNAEEVGHLAHTLGESVGLALRSLSGCPMEFNLRPAGVVRRQRIAKQKPFLVLAGLCFLLILAGGWQYFEHAAAVTDEMTVRLEEKVRPLKDMDTKISAVRADIKRQEETATPLLKAVADRGYWTQVINDINARLPEDYIWLVGFELAEAKPEATMPAKAGAKPSPTVVLLKGLYLENARAALVVDDFVDKLKESSLYEVGDITRSVPNDSDWTFEYSIPLTLKNPISLK